MAHLGAGVRDRRGEGKTRQVANKGVEPVRRSARLMPVVSSWISDQDLRVGNTSLNQSLQKFAPLICSDR